MINFIKMELIKSKERLDYIINYDTYKDNPDKILKYKTVMLELLNQDLDILESSMEEL